MERKKREGEGDFVMMVSVRTDEKIQRGGRGGAPDPESSSSQSMVFANLHM
jgi:hypothetical protein